MLVSTKPDPTWLAVPMFVIDEAGSVNAGRKKDVENI